MHVGEKRRENLHFFDSSFLKFQEIRESMVKRCNVHGMGNTKTYTSRILRFLNRGLRERGCKETMEERIRQNVSWILRFEKPPGEVEGNSECEGYSEDRERVIEWWRRRSEKLHFFVSRNVKIEITRYHSRCQCYRFLLTAMTFGMRRGKTFKICTY